ncbi:MAG: helix-turn-helix domain-containing protein [Treponema sp.]|jgi:transcriptional regulator with XRE-family HTH domain|nr:helix-turn-helix domain-containing protein [Treponema sp.]
MNMKVSFGKNLKFYRRERRLSQEQLSEKADISIKHLSAIERGLTFVSAELLEKLSESLEVPAFYFFVGEQELFYNDVMLDTIDRAVEKHLLRALEDIKADLRRNNPYPST